MLILLIPHPCYGTETIINDQLEALNLGTFIQEGEKVHKGSISRNKHTRTNNKKSYRESK